MLCSVRFEVFTKLSVLWSEIQVFWDVTLCWLANIR